MVNPPMFFDGITVLLSMEEILHHLRCPELLCYSGKTSVGASQVKLSESADDQVEARNTI